MTFLLLARFVLLAALVAVAGVCLWLELAPRES
jgi:hypothetical protein